jgi:hypothetical protein
MEHIAMDLKPWKVLTPLTPKKLALKKVFLLANPLKIS